MATARLPEEPVMAQPMEEVPGRSERALDVSRSDRRRSLDAVHLLESVASSASPGRASAWRTEVLDALDVLTMAIAEQAESYEQPAALLAEVALEHPRLRTWVRQLRRQWHELSDSATAVRDRLAEADDPAWSPADVREQLRWLITTFHHHQAREADLVFDALGVDLGRPDRPGTARAGTSGSC
jgi:hypothetical protein